MTDPAVLQGMERLMLRQVANELLKTSLPSGDGASASAFQDLFASTLADAIAEGQEAQSR